MSWSLERTMGRVILAKVASPIKLDDVMKMAMRMGALAAETPDRILLCTDLSEAVTFTPDVADVFLTIMRKDNPKILRSGFLCTANATFSLQLERMVREANSPARRAFRDASSLLDWMAEVATPPERGQLRSFLLRAA